MRTCIFCKQKEAIKRSHIIPEYLHDFVYDDDKKKTYVIDTDLKKIQTRQSGHYEPLLCRDCEGHFNKHYENPCLSFFRSIPDIAEPGKTLNLPACPSLKILALSILWRASFSVSPHWGNIYLGKHQDLLESYLRTNPKKSSYKLWIYAVTNQDGKIEKSIVSSVQFIKVDSHYLYHFMAHGIQFVIKISSHEMTHIPLLEPDFDKPMPIHVFDIRQTPSTALLFMKRPA